MTGAGGERLRSGMFLLMVVRSAHEACQTPGMGKPGVWADGSWACSRIIETFLVSSDLWEMTLPSPVSAWQVHSSNSLL